MSTLDDIGIKHGTDKASVHHDYLRHFDRLFTDLRGQPLTFLEMGTCDNKSLRTWAEYFEHPDARIFGQELESGYHDPNLPRVTRFIGSQAVPSDLKVIVDAAGCFDVIVDDAGHFSNEIIVAFEYLFPFVKPGGLYIIEDVCGPGYTPDYIRGAPRSSMQYMYDTIDVFNGRGIRECARVREGDSWQEAMIEEITFRKGLIILRRR